VFRAPGTPPPHPPFVPFRVFRGSIVSTSLTRSGTRVVLPGQHRNRVGHPRRAVQPPTARCSSFPLNHLTRRAARSTSVLSRKIHPFTGCRVLVNFAAARGPSVRCPNRGLAIPNPRIRKRGPTISHEEHELGRTISRCRASVPQTLANIRQRDRRDLRGPGNLRKYWYGLICRRTEPAAIRSASRCWYALCLLPPYDGEVPRSAGNSGREMWGPRGGKHGSGSHTTVPFLGCVQGIGLSKT